MDRIVSDASVAELIYLLRLRKEIFAIMQGPQPEAEILRWLLKMRGYPASEIPAPFGKFISPPPEPKGELPMAASEITMVDAGRALRTRLTVVGGRPRKKRS